MKLYSDATAVAQAIKKGNLSPREAVQMALDQIAALNPELNAVHFQRSEQALEEADRLRDFSAPFAGVPILLKDLGHHYEGCLDTSGSALLKGNRAKTTNHLVASILEAGFIVIAMTNVPEFGIKFISDSKYYGTVKNPIDPAYHAGGSSGGAAAAVQSGMVPLAAASDGGGSIRIPASFSGLIGLKPSTGRMATGPGAWRSWGGGATNFALTRSMRDTESLFKVMQTDKYDAMPFRLPTISAEAVQEAHEGVKELKIGYALHSEYDSDEAVQAVKETVKFLKSHGFQVKAARPNLSIEPLIESYYLMNGIEIDKIFNNIEKKLGRAIQAHEVEPITWALREYGKKIPGSCYSAAFDLWDQASAAVSAFHEEYDLFLHPTTTGPAPGLEEVVYDEEIFTAVKDYQKLSREEIKRMIMQSFESANRLSPYALIDNLTGCPAVSLPLHTCRSGLPLGLQFSAAKGREDLLLAVGCYLEENDRFHYYN